MERIISQIVGIKKVKIRTFESYNDEIDEVSEIYLSNPRLQNVYLGDEVTETEPDFVYVPESSRVGEIGSSLAAGAHQTSVSCSSSQNIVSTIGGQTIALAQSMMLLEESLTSGAIIGQFEQLYRR